MICGQKNSCCDIISGSQASCHDMICGPKDSCCDMISGSQASCHDVICSPKDTCCDMNCGCQASHCDMICGPKASCHDMISPASLCSVNCSWLPPFKLLPPQYHNHFCFSELYGTCIWSNSFKWCIYGSVVQSCSSLKWGTLFHYFRPCILNINVLCIVSILILLSLLSEGLWHSNFPKQAHCH